MKATTPGSPAETFGDRPRVKEFDLSFVRRWVSGGAPLAMEVLQRFEALTGHAPKEGYGLTEIAPLGTLQVLDKPARPGSVGLPAPHTVLEVVDLETGERVLPIGEGEICFRGPQVMKGYWKKPEATEEAFRGGRFHTGDIGAVKAQRAKRTTIEFVPLRDGGTGVHGAVGVKQSFVESGRAGTATVPPIV